MSDINTVVLGGRLTADPVGYSGDTVARMSVASNRSFKPAGSDEWVEQTVFAEVSAFSGLAKKALTKLSKGSIVTVQGRLELNQWTTDDGTKRSQLRVIATEISSEDFFTKAAPPEEPKKPARRSRAADKK